MVSDGLSKKRKGRILIAEDNMVNQKIARAILERVGYRVDAVANGSEAVAALISTPYDLVLMDIQMPEMDGLEATRAIRSSQSRVLNPDIPIIALTARAMISDRKNCIEAGLDDYLSKPVKPNVLREVVGKWLALDTSDQIEAISAAPSQAGEESVAREALSLINRNLNILVVDDDLVNQKVAKGMLIRRGDTVTLARDGQAALDILEDATHEPFDVILMDVHMPRMDGYTATRKIRQLEQQTGDHMPIIAITASVLVEDRKECFEAGMDEFLTKPLYPEALNAALARVVDRFASGPTPPEEQRRLEESIATDCSDTLDTSPQEVFDYESLIKQHDQDGPFVSELVSLFCEHRAEYMNAIQIAIEANESEELSNSAHKLKGALGYICASAAATAAADLEHIADAGNLGVAEAGMQRLTQEMDRLREALQQVTARLPPQPNA